MEAPDADRHRVLPTRRRPRTAPPGPEDSLADALLSAAGQGDVRALGAFYDQTAPAVFGLLRGILGEPALAEQATERVYLHLWRAAPLFDPHNGSAHSLLLRAADRELTHHIHAIIAAATTPAASTSPPERQ